jgi:undecaprenyl-diphosphatase
MHDLDARLFHALYGGREGAWAPAMLLFTIAGGGWSTLLLVPLLRAPRTRGFAAALSAAIATQAVLVWLVKRLVGRVRPWIALGLPAPFGLPHDPSFPSGHAAGSFCVAAFLAVALPRIRAAPRLGPRAVACAGFVLASLVAYSRVYLAAHFPSDVLAGGVLGGVIGALAGRLYVRRTRVPAPDGQEGR